MNAIKPIAKQRLLQVSTATLTTALFKCGFRNVFLQGLQRLCRSENNMVGQAFTPRFIPAPRLNVPC